MDSQGAQVRALGSTKYSNTVSVVGYLERGGREGGRGQGCEGWKSLVGYLG